MTTPGAGDTRALDYPAHAGVRRVTVMRPAASHSDFMSPGEIKRRRLELGLTVEELAFALNVEPQELLCIEQGNSKLCLSPEFEEAFDIFEERVFGCFTGA